MAPRMTRRGFVAGVLGAVGVAAMGKSVAAESSEAAPAVLALPRELTVDGWDLSDLAITVNGVGPFSGRAVPHRATASSKEASSGTDCY